MEKLYAIILTLIAGIFFLIGGLISKKAKNKDRLNAFSVALAFVIIINLMVFDLWPEIFELLEGYKSVFKIGIIFISTMMGILSLKILDIFIPDHHHEHYENEKNIEEHKSHIKHIGILTLLSLVLHNILEGFAIFGMALSNFKIGLMISISVALHNIPLGTHIFSSLNLENNKILIGGLTLSSLLGGILFLIVGNVNSLVLAVITSITLGMLIYISLLELLPEIIVNRKKIETKTGILVGLIIAVISIFI